MKTAKAKDLPDLPDCVRKHNRIPVEPNQKATIRQGYNEVFAKYDYTAIEKRIRYTLLYLAGANTGVDTIFGRVDVDQYERRYATIPIKMLMGKSKSHNYDDIRQSIDSFNTKTVWYKDENGNAFKAYPLVAVYLYQSRGNVVLKIDRDVWESYKNESDYYSELDILRAMQFSSNLEMRMYELANLLTKTEEYSIEFIRDLWFLSTEYKRTADLVRAIERAAKKLNQGDISLIIEKITSGSSHKVKSLRFTPIVISDESVREKDIRERLKKYGLKYILNPYDIQCLHNAGFKENDICANIVTLKIRQQQVRLQKYDTRAFGDSINSLAERSKDKDNPQGWIISAIKAMNEEFAGVNTVRR